MVWLIFTSIFLYFYVLRKQLVIPINDVYIYIGILFVLP